MDFSSLPRRQLQTLCKQHKIPANLTNVAMADALDKLLNKSGNETMLQATMDLLTPSKAAAALEDSTVTPGYSARVTRSQMKKGNGEPSMGSVISMPGKNLLAEMAQLGSSRKPVATRSSKSCVSDESNVATSARKSVRRQKPTTDEGSSSNNTVAGDDKEEAESKLTSQHKQDVNDSVLHQNNEEVPSTEEKMPIHAVSGGSQQAEAEDNVQVAQSVPEVDINEAVQHIEEADDGLQPEDNNVQVAQSVPEVDINEAVQQDQPIEEADDGLQPEDNKFQVDLVQVRALDHGVQAESVDSTMFQAEETQAPHYELPEDVPTDAQEMEHDEAEQAEATAEQDDVPVDVVKPTDAMEEEVKEDVNMELKESLSDADTEAENDDEAPEEKLPRQDIVEPETATVDSLTDALAQVSLAVKSKKLFSTERGKENATELKNMSMRKLKLMLKGKKDASNRKAANPLASNAGKNNFAAAH